MSSKVSVVIPSYNHKRYILETLKSIRSQTYDNIELIVVDDGSQDGSGDYLKSLKSEYDFQLILKKNEGICATINRGLDLATGEYIVIIASDDFIPKDRIKEQVAVFRDYDVDVITGGMTLIDEKSNILRFVSPPLLGEVAFTDMLDKGVIFAPTAMFKNSTFKKYGQYNPDHIIEDYSMWLRILSRGGKILNIDKNWAFYRTTEVITRHKVDWYYKGLEQVFLEYRDDPVVLKAFTRRKIKYLVKVSILDGFEGLKKQVNEDIDGIRLWHFFALYIIAVLPRFVRNVLKTRVNRI